MKSQSVISILIALIGFVTFTLLLLNGNVETVGYFSLLSLLSLVCIVVPVLGRLKEFDVKNLKLTLDRIEQVKGEIYAKEESLKQTSYILSELITTTSSLTGVWGDDNSSKYSKALIRNKIRKLGTNLKIPDSDIEELFKYERLLNDLPNYEGEERKEKWKEFTEVLRQAAEESA